LKRLIEVFAEHKINYELGIMNYDQQCEEHGYIKRANTRFAPTVCVLLNGLYWG